MQIFYNITVVESAELISYLNIFHPYGITGNLPIISSQDSIEFGKDPDYDTLWRLTDKIKTFTEGTDPESSEIMSIKKSMYDADIIVFLGFAFHHLNVNLLTPNLMKENEKLRYCYATVFEVSKSNQDAIKDDILFMYQDNVKVNLAEETSRHLISDYERSLWFYGY